MKLRHVLLIDDSDSDLLYGRIVLERAGIAQQVLSFGTALEALNHLQQDDGHDGDLILLDINMPEMNGFEFIEAYQQLRPPHQARALIVMLTSSPAPVDRDRALAYPSVKGYVVKPLDLEAARELLEFAG